MVARLAEGGKWVDNVTGEEFVGHPSRVLPVGGEWQNPDTGEVLRVASCEIVDGILVVRSVSV